MKTCDNTYVSESGNETSMANASDMPNGAVLSNEVNLLQTAS